MHIDEMKYFGRDGSVYPWDVRHNPADSVFCEVNPDGSVTLQVHTEPGFKEVILIYNDGLAKATSFSLWASTHRFQYWKCTFKPETPQFRYGFALKRTDNTVVYIGPGGAISLLVQYFQLNLDIQKPIVIPEWAKGAFIYQIFPERFANGDPEITPASAVSWGTAPHSFQFQGGDLMGILQKIDYLQELGVDLVYLNPVFVSPSNHKYDTIDYYNVDPAFGGNQALRELVRALHARDMRIILDASFNHCHPKFFAFQDILRNGPASAYWNWFTIYEHPIKIRIRENQLPSWIKNNREYWLNRLHEFEQQYNIPAVFVEDDAGPGVEPSYQAWMNTITMPKINLSNPETRSYFLEVAEYWLREYDIDGWRMDVVPWVVDDFWIDLRGIVKKAKPDAYLLAEVWGDVSHWLMGDRFDATMNYTFRQLALDYFGTASMDTWTFAERCKQMLMMYPSKINSVNQNLLSSHDTPRFLHMAGGKSERLRLATLFQFTMPGAPGIYYGDEIGMTGEGDPDCRRAFPWDDREIWDQQTLKQVKELAWLRKRTPALRLGDWEMVYIAGEALAYTRLYEDQHVLVIISRNEDLRELFVPIPHSSASLLWGSGLWEPESDGIRVKELSAWSGLIILL